MEKIFFSEVEILSWKVLSSTETMHCVEYFFPHSVMFLSALGIVFGSILVFFSYTEFVSSWPRCTLNSIGIMVTRDQ